MIILPERINREAFRRILKQIGIENRESIKNAGREPYDEAMMFRMIVLQSLYGLSDDQMEFQLKDRRSFERFFSGDDASYQMPDAKTIWFSKERFKEHGIARKALKKLNHELKKANLMEKSGKLVDASFVRLPRQRISRDENRHIRAEGP